MNLKRVASQTLDGLRIGLTSLALLQFSIAAPIASADDNPSTRTRTPIKHVIVIIGENRSFDHVFATYKPKNGERVWNLLSKGIIDANGKPGPNYSLSAQYSAVDNTTFAINPGGKTLYTNVPP